MTFEFAWDKLLHRLLSIITINPLLSGRSVDVGYGES